jgi:hypothetical protein
VASNGLIPPQNAICAKLILQNTGKSGYSVDFTADKSKINIA